MSVKDPYKGQHPHRSEPDVLALSDAAGKFADHQMGELANDGHNLGLRPALVAAFLKGWAYSQRSQSAKGG